MGLCPSRSLGGPPPQQHNNRGLKTGGWLLKWPWTSKFWILGADCTFELQTSNYEQMEKSNLENARWILHLATVLPPRRILRRHQTHISPAGPGASMPLIKVLRTAGGIGEPKKKAIIAEVNHDNNDEPCPFPSLPVASAQGQNVHTTASTNLQYLYLPSVV